MSLSWTESIEETSYEETVDLDSENDEDLDEDEDDDDLDDEDDDDEEDDEEEDDIATNSTEADSAFHAAATAKGASPSNSSSCGGDGGSSSGGILRDPIYPNLIWTGSGRRTPVVVFSTEAVMKRDMRLAVLGKRFHLSFKLVRTESRVVRSVLTTHGFREVGLAAPDVNLIWTGCHLKPYILKQLADYQKVNHFPRSAELTRKDRLFKNVQRMQIIKGVKHFDFMPVSYVLPGDFQEFCTAFLRDKGPYIVKPIASSRGRGIFLCNRPDQVPLDEPLIVSRYIDNPFLIDGFKFDVRLYVAVTSYDPLVVYLYEEGLVRFATVKYQTGCRNLRSQCMHLTNYSVNKKNLDFVHNDNADVEDFGNKWSLGALLRYLKSLGKDTTVLMMKIEDVVIKALLSVELTITAGCRMFQPYRGVCFELYGFDIILDDTLRPWLLEVNLSPSLACDSPLDYKIKSHMITNLFNLIGIVCQDPKIPPTPPPQYPPTTMTAAGSGGSKDGGVGSPSTGRGRGGSERGAKSSALKGQPRLQRPDQRPHSVATTAAVIAESHRLYWTTSGSTMTSTDARMIRAAREEYQRRGGWLRVYPRQDSWHTYQGFYQAASSTASTLLLHQKLFPQVWYPSPATRHHHILTSTPSTASLAATMALAGKVGIPLHSLSESRLLCHQQQQLPLSQLQRNQGTTDIVARRLSLIYDAARDRANLYERMLGQYGRRDKPEGEEIQRRRSASALGGRLSRQRMVAVSVPVATSGVGTSLKAHQRQQAKKRGPPGTVCLLKKVSHGSGSDNKANNTKQNDHQRPRSSSRGPRMPATTITHSATARGKSSLPTPSRLKQQPPQQSQQHRSRYQQQAAQNDGQQQKSHHRRSVSFSGKSTTMHSVWPVTGAVSVNTTSLTTGKLEPHRQQVSTKTMVQRQTFHQQQAGRGRRAHHNLNNSSVNLRGHSALGTSRSACQSATSLFDSRQ